MSLNRVAFNNFINKALPDKKIEYSEKKAGNIGPDEEMILKEILYKKDFKVSEVKSVSNFVTLDEIEKLLR
ncbi:hypothetical protein ABG79_00386 [Caloramator mitchellensis]|uniref:Uncharacterized protein n=1 Tax=Caloramator mitchellensis TaxID=908809 RepID=A0A0R3JVP4_CALMK|nr:hypothetical protein [Caloramator mitchellensis]KRQ87585.1 hypothetical protein ABG79_00386 [Caloramator mitchellensis]